MLIELDEDATIIRLQAGSGDKSSYSTVTIEPCEKQPLSDEKTALYGGSHGKMFILYFDTDADVKEGDRIKIGTQYFRVESGGVNKRDDGTIADYLSAAVTRIDD
jgi:hypothetical protein